MIASLTDRLRGVRLLALDVDGVLTDGGLYMGESGGMQKRFAAQDGVGIRNLIESSVPVALISGLKADWLVERFKRLGITDFYLGVRDKAACLDDLLTVHGLTQEQVAYMGDDVIDLPVLERVGLAVGVPNGLPEVNRKVHWVTRRAGGEGAVRELCDLIVRHRKGPPRILGVIPVRMGARRFPGKPLVDLLGKPLFAWVYDRARSVGLDDLLVATDSPEIMAVCGKRGIPVCRTDSEHRCGTDRVARVAAERPADIILNIQGDEPMLEPDIIGCLVEELIRRPELDLATPCARFTDPDEAANSNQVKVVCDQAGLALYFSRAPVPYFRDRAHAEYRRHIGVYAFQQTALARFAALPPSPLEAAEGLEQLRALEAGMSIRVLEVASNSLSVDTPEDLIRVAERLRREGVA